MAHQPSIEMIAPQGDVILVVGTDHEVRKFRVFSQCLRAGSKVFAAMFGPNWSEGQSLSEQSPKDVALPDDDATAMAFICRALHFQGVPDGAQVPDPEELVCFMLHADKYNVVVAVEPMVRHWILSSKPDSDVDRVMLFAALCRLPYTKFESPFIFDLVTRHRASFFTFLEKPHLGQVLDYRDCVRLEETRTQLRFDLLALLEKENCGLNCAYLNSSKVREGYRDAKKTYGAGAMGTSYVVDVIMALKLIYESAERKAPLSTNHRRGQASPKCSCGCASQLYRKLDELYEKVMARVLHKDYDCVSWQIPS